MDGYVGIHIYSMVDHGLAHERDHRVSETNY